MDEDALMTAVQAAATTFQEHEAVWYVDQQRGFWGAAPVGDADVPVHIRYFIAKGLAQRDTDKKSGYLRRGYLNP